MEGVFIPVSLETLSAVSGKSTQEIISTLTEKGEDGKIVPISNQQGIDTSLLDWYKSNIGGIVSEKGKEQHQRGLRESREGFEKAVKQKYGIEMRWDEDGFAKIEQHLSKPNDMTDDDVKNSELFRKTVQDYNSKIEQLDTEYKSQLAEQRSSHIKDSLLHDVEKIVRDEKYKLTLSSSDDVTRNLLRLLVNDLQDDKTKLDKVNGEWKVLDSDGRPKQDDKFHNISFLNHVLSKAKTGYFPEMTSNPITSHSPGVRKDSMTVKVDGKEQTFSLPSIKTEAELIKWTSENMRKVPADVISQVSDDFYNKN